jgi:hypothetical protein
VKRQTLAYSSGAAIIENGHITKPDDKIVSKESGAEIRKLPRSSFIGAFGRVLFTACRLWRPQAAEQFTKKSTFFSKVIPVIH